MLFCNNDFIVDGVKGFSKEKLEEIKGSLADFEIKKAKESEIKEYIFSKLDLPRLNLIHEYLKAINLFIDNYFEEGEFNKLFNFFSDITEELKKAEQNLEIYSLNARNLKSFAKEYDFIDNIFEDIKKSSDLCNKLIEFLTVNRVELKPDYKNKILMLIEAAQIKKTSFLYNKLPKNLESWECIKKMYEIAVNVSVESKVILAHDKISVFNLNNLINSVQEGNDLKLELIYDYIYFLISIGVFSVNIKETVEDMVSVEVVKKNLRGFYTKLFKSFLNDFLLGIDEYFKDEKIVSLEDIKENLHDINDIDINSSVSAIILKIYEKIEFHFQEIFEDPKCVKNYGINVNKIHDFLSQIEDWVLKFEGYLKPYDDITAPIKKTLYNLKSEITRKEEEFETYIESINEEKIRTEGKTVIDKHIKRISEMLSYYQQEISKTLSEEFPELKSVRKLLKQYKQETLEIEKEVAQIIEDMKSKGVSPYSVMKEWEKIFHEKTKQMKFALSLMVSKLFNSFKDVIKEEELFFETMKNIQLMEDDIPLNFRFSFVLPEKLTEEKLKERIMAIRSQISLLDKLRELYSVELDKFENYVISKIKDRDKISSETCVVCHKKLNFSMDKFIKCPFCNSVMHYLCIAWWLESHGTCPVCNNNYLDPTSNMYSD